MGTEAEGRLWREAGYGCMPLHTQCFRGAIIDQEGNVGTRKKHEIHVIVCHCSLASTSHGSSEKTFEKDKIFIIRAPVSSSHVK